MKDFIFANKTLFVGFLLFCFAVAIFSSFFIFSIFLPAFHVDSKSYVFNWPDEMSNSFFVRQFMENSSFKYPEALNSQYENAIHPRSSNVLTSGEIVPVGFLGFLILLGLLAKFFGFFVAYLATPIFAALTIFVFFALIKIIFDKRVAVISAVLLCFFAPFLYFSQFVMLPNIAFLFFFVCGLFCLLKMVEESNLWSIGAGLSLSTALIIRPTETALFILLAILYLLFWGARISPQKIYLLAVVFILPINLMFFYNFKTYGDILSFGYMKTGVDGLAAKMPAEIVLNSNKNVLNYLALLFAPFGFHPRLAWSNMWQYTIELLWPIIILAICGFFNLKKFLHRHIVFYLLFSAIVFIWLHLFYGSWAFVDPIVKNNNFISISYVRYFLPATIWLLPLTAVFILKIYDCKKIKIFSRIIAIFLFGVLIIQNGYLVYFSKNDGLLAVQRRLIEYREIKDKSLFLIPKDDVVIIDNADKMIWPERKVIPFNDDFGVFQKISLKNTTKVYYLTYNGPEKIAEINRIIADKYDFLFNFTQEMPFGYSLWQLTLINE